MAGPLKHRGLVLASACMLVGAALPGAVAAQQVTDFSGCITGSQQLVKVAVGDAPMSPCGPYETEISWSGPTHTVVRSTTDDLIPGAELLTAEVEPGVLRVLSDGVRSTLGGNQDIVAGADGSIWAFKSQQFYKLGDAESHEWENDLFDTGQDSSEDIEVAPDGTLWWADGDGNGLKSFDDGTWTVRRPAPKGEQGSVDQVEVLDDGTVLASWWLGGRGDGQRKVGRLGEDGWEIVHSVGGSPDAWLGANQAGEVSLMLQTEDDQPLYRETFPASADGEVGRADRPQGRIEWMDVGSDGTIWISLEHGGLARHDESGWTEFDLPEGLYGLGGIQAAPDGSVWSATCGWAWGGCELLRFDGQSWGRFLGSLGLDDIDEIAFAADGTVWSISGANDLYVITPEAVAQSPSSEATPPFTPEDMVGLLPSQVGGIPLSTSVFTGDEWLDRAMHAQRVLADLDRRASDLVLAEAVYADGLSDTIFLTAMQVAGVPANALALQWEENRLGPGCAFPWEVMDIGGRQVWVSSCIQDWDFWYPNDEVLIGGDLPDGMSIEDVLAELP